MTVSRNFPTAALLTAVISLAAACTSTAGPIGKSSGDHTTRYQSDYRFCCDYSS